LARQAARRQRRRLVLGAARRGRAEDPGRRERARRAHRGSRAPRRGRAQARRDEPGGRGARPPPARARPRRRRLRGPAPAGARARAGGVSGVKVAYYSPLAPSRSGIADYSALLLPALAERIDVEVARPGRLRRTPRADVALYHVGNDAEAHGWIVEELRRR